jgi:hypothetical protein
MNNLTNSEQLRQAHNSNPLTNQERVAIANRGSNLSNVNRVRQSVSQPSLGRSMNRSFSPQRSPSMSSEYIGISSDSRNFLSSDRITHSSEISRSSDDIVFSSDRFRSSDDILEYLKYHPDYQKILHHPGQIDPIVALILSSITLGIGVCMCVLTHVMPGFAGGAVFSLASSLVLGAGIVGFTSSFSGLMNKDFSWKNLAKNIAADSMIALLTFGSGYGPSAIAGLALVGKNLTEKVIRRIGLAVGALVTSGVNTGCYVVRTYLEGRPIRALSLLMTIGGGAWSGKSAAGYATPYLKVEISNVLDVSSLTLGAERISSRLGNEIIRAYKYPNA